MHSSTLPFQYKKESHAFIASFEKEKARQEIAKHTQDFDLLPPDERPNGGDDTREDQEEATEDNDTGGGDLTEIKRRKQGLPKGNSDRPNDPAMVLLDVGNEDDAEKADGKGEGDVLPPIGDSPPMSDVLQGKEMKRTRQRKGKKARTWNWEVIYSEGAKQQVNVDTGVVEILLCWTREWYQ